jgi:hypothetical protein
LTSVFEAEIVAQDVSAPFETPALLSTPGMPACVTEIVPFTRN